MIYLILRDDDLSYWTSLPQIEEIYSIIFKRDLKVSSAVIPYSYKIRNPEDKDNFYIENTQEYISKNKVLVEWIKEKIASAKIEVLLHGYNHGFFIKEKSQTRLLTQEIRERVRKSLSKDVKIYPEFAIGSISLFEEKIIKGLDILSKTFSSRISTFVAPQEKICKNAACALAKFKLNISGIIESKLKIQRPFSISYVINLIKVLYFKKRFSIKYPRILNYGSHYELVAYHFTSKTSLFELKRMFSISEKFHAPFCLAFHSWQLFNNKKMLEIFTEFCDFVSQKDIIPATFSDVFEKKF